MNMMNMRFSKPQEQAVINARRYFNAEQRRLAEKIGNYAGIGNAQTLGRDVWQEWDREGVMVQRTILAVFDALSVNARPIPIGKSIHNFKMISDSGSISVSMDGRRTANLDKPLMKYSATAIPIVNSTYGFGFREVEAASTEGMTLEPDARVNANRRIAETLETAALVGYTDIVQNGQPSYGLRNHPNRNTRSHTFTLGTATGAQWLTAVTEHLKLLQADKFFRSDVITFLNYSDWFYASVTEFAVGYPKTILQKIQEIPGIGELVPCSSINASEIITVVKDRSVFEVLTAMPIVTQPMARLNPMDDYTFMTWAAAALEIKTDYAGNCGIAHSIT